MSKYERMNDGSAAKQLLRRTVRTEPDNAEAHFLLGRLYVQEGAYEKAMGAFGKSQSASPRFEEQIRFLKTKHARDEFQEGQEALEAGAYERAARAFRAVLTIQPKNTAAAKAVGQTLVQAGRLGQARTAYRRALKQAPEDVEILNNLSSLAVEKEDYTAAIKYARKALEQPEVPPPVRRRLAYALVETGRRTDALAHFERALREQPSPQLRRDYAFLLYNEEQYEAALPVLRRLSTSAADSSSLDVLRTLGETYGALGRPGEVAEVYRQILERRPQDEAALQRLIIAYEQMGDEERVQEYRGRLQRVRTDADR
jgi:tetratricopeptide (TPR) repeat protein